MVLIILSNVSLKTVIHTKLDLGALSFPLKTNKAKTLLAFSVLQKKKKKGDKFYAQYLCPLFIYLPTCMPYWILVPQTDLIWAMAVKALSPDPWTAP